MAQGGREECYKSKSAAARACVPQDGVTTRCVGTDCEAATSKKKRSTKRPVHRKERHSREGWRAVPITPLLKGRMRGEMLTLFSASVCRYGTFFLGTLHIFIYSAELNSMQLGES